MNKCSIPDIKAAYKHTKAGTFLFNLCAALTKFLVKHRKLYYFLACTWGIFMTVLGLLVSGVLYVIKLFAKSRIKITFEPYHLIYSISVGPNYWGGCELGLCFLRDQKSIDSINAHEFGHTFQNCLFGPLFPFIVAIPSASRWWARELNKDPNKKFAPYDGVWFEDAATQCGLYAAAYLSTH
jgi:hypothetical protein